MTLIIYRICIDGLVDQLNIHRMLFYNTLMII